MSRKRKEEGWQWKIGERDERGRRKRKKWSGGKDLCTCGLERRGYEYSWT